MKFPKLLASITSEPLLITEGAYRSIVQLIAERAGLAPEMKREGIGICGEAVELEQMQIIDGIAHIPIGGAIGYRLGSIEKGAGAVDVSDVTKEIDEAEANPEVRSILFDIDSPGGMVTGTPELGDRISRIEKPCYAFTSSLMASAAYWCGAATDGIFATKSASIGSIGVLLPWVDQSEAFKMEGLRVKVFASGQFKGMGFPGTTLTKDQEKFLQDRVSTIADMFFSHVRSNRPGVPNEAMQGQTFMAAEAQQQGLIDEIVGSKEEVLALIR